MNFFYDYYIHYNYHAYLLFFVLFMTCSEFPIYISVWGSFTVYFGGSLIYWPVLIWHLNLTLNKESIVHVRYTHRYFFGQDLSLMGSWNPLGCFWAIGVPGTVSTGGHKPQGDIGMCSLHIGVYVWPSKPCDMSPSDATGTWDHALRGSSLNAPRENLSLYYIVQ